MSNLEPAEILINTISWIESSASAIKIQFDRSGYDYEHLKRYSEKSVKEIQLSGVESRKLATEIFDDFVYEDSDFYGDYRELIYQSFVTIPSLVVKLEAGFEDLSINFNSPSEEDFTQAFLQFGEHFTKVYLKYGFKSS